MIPMKHPDSTVDYAAVTESRQSDANVSVIEAVRDTALVEAVDALQSDFRCKQETVAPLPHFPNRFANLYFVSQHVGRVFKPEIIFHPTNASEAGPELLINQCVKKLSVWQANDGFRVSQDHVICQRMSNSNVVGNAGRSPGMFPIVDDNSEFDLWSG